MKTGLFVFFASLRALSKDPSKNLTPSAWVSVLAANAKTSHMVPPSRKNRRTSSPPPQRVDRTNRGLASQIDYRVLWRRRIRERGGPERRGPGLARGIGLLAAQMILTSLRL